MSGSEHSSSIETNLESGSSSGSDSSSSRETPMIPMAYSFEPIQVALQRLPVMILTWVRLQPAAMHLQIILPPSNHLSLPSKPHNSNRSRMDPFGINKPRPQQNGLAGHSTKILDQKF